MTPKMGSGSLNDPKNGFRTLNDPQNGFRGPIIYLVCEIPMEDRFLVIPKGKYVDLDDFSQNASAEEMVGLLKGINIVAKKLGISVDTGKGYRIIANINEDGGQEVPHLHFHLFGGEKIGKMVE